VSAHYGIIAKSMRPIGAIIADQDPHRAVAGIRHIDAVRKRDVGNTLRHIQSGDPPEDPAGCEIDRGHAVSCRLSS
jgi:hypothetical protein